MWMRAALLALCLATFVAGIGRSAIQDADEAYYAEAGREILRQGGSAADAAIATELVLGLVEPQSSGLGGGAFLVYWEAQSRSLATFDGRETAPAAAKPDRFMRDGKPINPIVKNRESLAEGTEDRAHDHRVLGALGAVAAYGPWAERRTLG